MISLDKAKALAKVLPWEPQEGDWYYHDQHTIHPQVPNRPMVYTNQNNYAANRLEWAGQVPDEDLPLFAPRLDQLLSDIEARGWNADSVTLRDGGYGCDIYWLSATVHTKYMTFAGVTREDAAAEARLWILREEAKSK